MLTPNQNLRQSRYRVINQIRQNGAETGYEAFDNSLGASVLLREIHDDVGKIATSAQLEARKTSFAEKAQFLTEMKHKSILTVREFFSEIDNHYLVTELPEGGWPAELLEKNKALFPISDVADWIYELLDALSYLHKLTPPLIHGEVKPENVCLAADGKAKLIVFNLVKNTDEANASRRRPVINQTFDAAALPYLALEQIWQGLDTASKKVILTNYDDRSERELEQPADARTDVFSLAATAYYFLTGQPPTDALTRSIDILEGKADPLPLPSDLNPLVPSEISDVLMKALEIKREDRFSSAVIMSQVLRTAFVRVKGQEANSAASASAFAAKIDAAGPARADEDTFLEIPPAALKRTVEAPPKNIEIEVEQARQLELIKRQLREAESLRQEAERRAAEAEKRLHEAEKHNVAAASTAAVHAMPAQAEKAEKAVLHESAPEMTAEPDVVAYQESLHESVYPSVSSDDDFPSLFAGQPKESGGFKKIAAAAVALFVLGGAGFGIWTMTQSKPGETMSVNAPTSAAVPASQPGAEETKTETVGQPSASPATNDQAVTSADPAATEASAPVTNPVRKPIAANPPPQVAQVKKTTPNPVKTAAPQKKITLDDLLKDN